MKRTMLLISALLISSIVFPQAPDAFKYQAVVRDNSGNLITEQSVGIQIEILKGAPDGTSIYTETHSVTTNTHGLVNLEIGSGTSTDDFTSINWGDDDYFLSVSLDATGGTSYELMGTSQLLSVPYALHSSVADSVAKESQTLTIDGNTLSISDGNSVELPPGGTDPSAGKFMVAFQGNISDSEAVQRIANEVGTNTKYILINNTTQLTALNFSGVKDLILMEVRDNSSLATIEAEDLESCQEISFSDNQNLATCNFQSLTISRSIQFQNNNNLSVFDLSLEYVRELNIYFSPLLGNINLAKLEAYEIGFINCGFTSLSAPNLNSEVVSIRNCSSLTSVDLSGLSDPNIFAIVGCSSLTSADISNLKSTDNFSLEGNPLLTSINLSNLELVTNQLNIQSCGISSLSLPKLNNSFEFRVFENASLTSIEIPSLVDFYSFMANQNTLTSETVNNLLAYFASISPDINGKSIYLEAQAPPAPPTGQGITDKATLEANGNFVATD